MIIALDTETTGLKNHSLHGHPQVIELATIKIDNSFSFLKSISKIEDKNSFSKLIYEFVQQGEVTRYRPSMDIDKRAIEVHGISFRELLTCPKSEEIKLPEDTTYILGHNVQYDYRCLGKPKDIKCLCTLNLAKKIDKRFGVGFPNHKLDTLTTYFYGDMAQNLVENSHQALVDTIKTIIVLAKLVEYLPNIQTFTELYTFQETLKKTKKVNETGKEKHK